MSFSEQEADRLVAFFKGKGFTKSSEISHYIRTHNMRREWPNITGNLTMESGGDIWNFDGGISPAYYAYVCDELKLGNNGSRSSVIDFTPYAEKVVASSHWKHYKRHKK